MDHDALELLNVAQKAILVLDAIGRLAVLPFPFVSGEGLDLGDEVAHLIVLEHAPELPVELTRLPGGDTIETPGAFRHLGEVGVGGGVGRRTADVFVDSVVHDDHGEVWGPLLSAVPSNAL